MKQKANHHLEFLADLPERGAQQIFSLPLPAESSSSRRQQAAASGQMSRASPRAASQVPGADEDAAGESDDGGGAAVDGVGADPFRDEAGAGPQSQTAANEEATRQTTPGEYRICQDVFR